MGKYFKTPIDGLMVDKTTGNLKIDKKSVQEIERSSDHKVVLLNRAPDGNWESIRAKYRGPRQSLLRGTPAQAVSTGVDWKKGAFSADLTVDEVMRATHEQDEKLEQWERKAEKRCSGSEVRMTPLRA